MNLDKINNLIKNLDLIDPNEDYAYERALNLFMNVKLPVLITIIPPGYKFFRTRSHDSDLLFNKITDISLPPKFAIQAFARCNRPFQPIFYCSENRATSYMELIEYWVKSTTFGEKLYVSIGKWNLINSLQCILITTPDQEARITEYDKTYGPIMDKFINDFDSETQEATKLFYRYICQMFRKPAKDDVKTYIITTAYCNLALMLARGQASAIFYPSVPFQGNGVNFAINSSFANNTNLELEHVLRSEFTVSENKLKKHDFKETQTIEHKRIDKEKNLIEW